MERSGGTGDCDELASMDGSSGFGGLTVGESTYGLHFFFCCDRYLVVLLDHFRHERLFSILSHAFNYVNFHLMDHRYDVGPALARDNGDHAGKMGNTNKLEAISLSKNRVAAGRSETELPRQDLSFSKPNNLTCLNKGIHPESHTYFPRRNALQ